MQLALAPTLLDRRFFRLLRLHLRLRHDQVDLVHRQLAHLHQVVGLNHRQVVVRQKAFPNQPVGQLLIHSLQRTVSEQGLFELLVQLVSGHDLDVPATQLARQPYVLPSPADGQRKLVFPNQDDCPAQHRAQDHLLHLGRLQRVGDQHLHVVVPADNVNPLARQLLDDVLDPVSADPDACPHTVHPLVHAAHRHLRPVARLASHRLDLDHPVGDLRNLLLEQPRH